MQCDTLQNAHFQNTPDKLGNAFIFVMIITVIITYMILAVSPVATPGIIFNISSYKSDM